MARRQPWRGALGVLFLLLVGIDFAASHSHDDHHSAVASSNHNNNSTIESAKDLVAKALLNLTGIGLARFRHTATSTPDHCHGNANSQGYHIPPELAEAARILAESSPQLPTGNHSEVVASARSKFIRHGGPTSDKTNTPLHLQTPEGRLSVYDGVGGSSQESGNASNGYWMLDMASQGARPLAPSGYQVWRNVRDYGTVGDGVTDDTAAINRAIWSAGRRGADCDTVPAVVYFPAGTYLVSSSLTQGCNTQLLGDVTGKSPTLLAASSFVGMGVITSRANTSGSKGHPNTNNGFRSIRDLKIDLQLASATAYICGIVWQAAHGASIENIEFYMRYTSDGRSNQGGIYVLSGSGGLLADLIFVGGGTVAYFENQEITTDHLVFLHGGGVWIYGDSVWTMHDCVFESCSHGVIVEGRAGRLDNTKPPAGSLTLIDSIFSDTTTGASLFLSSNSTTLHLENCAFYGATNAVVVDPLHARVLLAADPTGNLVVDNWESGSNPSSAAHIPPTARNPALSDKQYPAMAPSLLTRRRPSYATLPSGKVMNVKALGAAGDGVTDDTAVLNAILDGAVNTSSVVFFPFGVYRVEDTLRVPVGSRIVGPAWARIVGAGSKFGDETRPRAVVQVGRSGEAGVVEIQGMVFAVEEDAAGAVVVEWNVRETSLASAGLWDSHIRVGDAKATGLQAEDSASTVTTKPRGRGPLLLMHLAPGSTAYIENSWLSAADHDAETASLDHDVYASRGLLVDADHAWLWATTIDCQYQISNPNDILMVPSPPKPAVENDPPKFAGYRVWTTSALETMNLALPSVCTSALTQPIHCHAHTKTFVALKDLPVSLGDPSLTDAICDPSCGDSLKTWSDRVTLACEGHTISDMPPALRGSRVWAGYNVTCLRDPSSGEYCS
ncbi:pectin lyase fold/virulence factor, partial [Staphylotrichum tortipilum]